MLGHDKIEQLKKLHNFNIWGHFTAGFKLWFYFCVSIQECLSAAMVIETGQKCSSGSHLESVCNSEMKNALSVAEEVEAGTRTLRLYPSASSVFYVPTIHANHDKF